MSLFENEQYRWRDTYFVLFSQEERPTAEAVLQAFESLGPRFTVENVQSNAQGMLESLTLLSPDDFAAMDVSYIAGDEVIEQVENLVGEMGSGPAASPEEKQVERIRQCNARFDIYHFEQVALSDEDDDEGFFDPGALLIMLQCLAGLCQGIGIDPQTGTVV